MSSPLYPFACWGLAGFKALLGHFVAALKADGKKKKEAAVANLRAILKKVQRGAVCGRCFETMWPSPRNWNNQFCDGVVVMAGGA